MERYLVHKLQSAKPCNCVVRFQPRSHTKAWGIDESVFLQSNLSLNVYIFDGTRQAIVLLYRVHYSSSRPIKPYTDAQEHRSKNIEGKEDNHIERNKRLSMKEARRYVATRRREYSYATLSYKCRKGRAKSQGNEMGYEREKGESESPKQTNRERRISSSRSERPRRYQ